MGKYNFELDLDTKNSTSIIIDMINKNSRILEFGPAYGRLTKYLRDTFGCIVDIVEIDEESGKIASEYANKSFIGPEYGNIEKYYWFDNLKDVKYDYIIFEDVLEHLYWPNKVLMKSKQLLNDKGKIIMSIPNFGHNAILINLFNNRFQYNSTGLLDNTHIRFFTYNTIQNMLKSVNLRAVIEKATYCQVANTEMNVNYQMLDSNLHKYFRNREYGNVYQFIIEAEDIENCSETSPLRLINVDKNCEYEFVCYIKDLNTNNYTEEKTIRQHYRPEDKVINITLPLSEFNNIISLRLDPINTNCIIRLNELCLINKSGEELDCPINNHNAVVCENNIFIFDNIDPQLYIDLNNNNINSIHINFEILEYASDGINHFINVLNQFEAVRNEEKSKQRSEMDSLHDTIRYQKQKIEESERLITQLRNEVDDLKKIKNDSNVIIDKLENNIVQLNSNILSNEIGRCTQEVTNYEKIIRMQEKTLNEWAEELNNLKIIIDEKNALNIEFQRQIDEAKKDIVKLDEILNYQTTYFELQEEKKGFLNSVVKLFNTKR